MSPAHYSAPMRRWVGGALPLSAQAGSEGRIRRPHRNPLWYVYVYRGAVMVALAYVTGFERR
jgi:hypothetical protein